MGLCQMLSGKQVHFTYWRPYIHPFSYLFKKHTPLLGKILLLRTYDENGLIIYICWESPSYYCALYLDFLILTKILMLNWLEDNIFLRWCYARETQFRLGKLYCSNKCFIYMYMTSHSYIMSYMMHTNLKGHCIEFGVVWIDSAIVVWKWCE